MPLTCPPKTCEASVRSTHDALPRRFAGLLASTKASNLGRIGSASGEGVELPHSIRRVAALDESEARFSLHGEFDLFNKAQLSGALSSSVASPTLTVDLAHATFIDASTLNVFAHVASRRRELGATQLRIVNVNSHLRKIFSICQLDNVFDIEGAAGRLQPRISRAGPLSVASLP